MNPNTVAHWPGKYSTLLARECCDDFAPASEFALQLSGAYSRAYRPSAKSRAPRSDFKASRMAIFSNEKRRFVRDSILMASVPISRNLLATISICMPHDSVPIAIPDVPATCIRVPTPGRSRRESPQGKTLETCVCSARLWIALERRQIENTRRWQDWRPLQYVF